jgi:AcrR family transcriptional regulator
VSLSSAPVGPGQQQAPVRPQRRRRRSPEEAEREIVDAANALLSERPFRDMTVDEVMRRTELSRPSFYVYFRDRHHLVLRVVEGISEEMFVLADRWLKGGPDGRSEIRYALEGVVAAFHAHGPVLRALRDAAADDPGVEAVWDNLNESFAVAIAEHIENEQAAGKVGAGDAQELGKVLVGMCERYLLENFGQGEPQIAREKIVDTLSTVWIGALYGRD